MTAMHTTEAGRIVRSVQELAVLPACIHMTTADITGREVRGLLMLNEEREAYRAEAAFFDGHKTEGAE